MKMRTLSRVITTLIVLALIISGSALHPKAQESARQRIKAIKDYVVYYGKGRIDDLARFDLAIIQPDTLTAAEISQLKAKGTLVISYLSVGEAEPGREWYSDGRVNPRWLLGRNNNWGSYFVNANEQGWQKLMVELTGEFLAKGFDGVFLDTVDTVDVYPDTKAGMIKIVQSLREAYPDALLVQNRGFTIIEDVTSAIDGVMFESLTGSYDFNKKEYIYADNSFLAKQMVELSKRTGIVILALDYAPPDNPAMAYVAVQAARKYGFVSAVSVILLDDIPDYGLDQGGADDIRVRSIEVQSSGSSTYVVVMVENVGLGIAAEVPVSLSIDGNQVATTTYEQMDIGKQVEWRYEWATPPSSAVIRVTAFSLTDKKAGNNTLTLRYSAETVAIEPLLPPDQQKRRPAENGPELVATAITELFTIDGDLSDWFGFPCAEVNSADQISFGDKSSWRGRYDLSGRVCYAWDSENLYVGFEIYDDMNVQKYEGSDLWRGDHVELWFDTQLQLDFDSAAANDDDFQIGVSPGDFDKVAPSFFIWTPPTLADVYAAVEWAVVRTPPGYSAEIRLPAVVLKGLRLATDHAIGATFDPSDTDTPGSSEQEMMLSTAPKTVWGTPTLWNNLVFKGEPTVTAAATK
ncbi:MAG: endo alpha-1,4 polygalactosaminidase [Anaerolineae bacterium]|nr:endo alpha-1,4 polygalactosaminidase [Anaerolineae bacterium]